MRIMFVFSSMPRGGMEIFTVNLAKKLAEKNNEVGILTFKSQDQAAALIENAKIKILTCERKGKFNLLFLSKLNEHLEGFRPEAILSLSSFTYFFVELSKRSSGLKIPHFIAFHSFKPVSIKEVIFENIFLFFSKFLKAYYLFVSEKQLVFNQRYYHFPRNRCFLIHNAVDVNFFSPVHKEINNYLSIIHIANLRPEKDQRTLIKSLEVVDKRLTSWRLTFVAKDKYNLLRKLKNYLRNKNLIDKVVFFEARDQESIKNFLALSDIFVLTSIVEVSPMAALEAMAMGVPCILTDVGGCSEIVEDGYNGYLVKPRDYQGIAEKILYLYNHKDLLSRMKENARNRVLEKFNLETCAGKYLEIFANAIQ